MCNCFSIMKGTYGFQKIQKENLFELDYCLAIAPCPSWSLISSSYTCRDRSRRP